AAARGHKSEQFAAQLVLHFHYFAPTDGTRRCLALPAGRAARFESVSALPPGWDRAPRQRSDLRRPRIARLNSPGIALVRGSGSPAQPAVRAAARRPDRCESVGTAPTTPSAGRA